MYSSIKRALRSLAFLIIALAIPIAVHAVDISGALWTSTITFVNVAIPLSEIQAPFEMSGSSLIDSSFITSDALNTALQSGGLDFPSMPPSSRTRMLGAVQDDSGIFTDLTTAANNSSFADVALLTTGAAINDAFYFIGDNPFRILTLNIGQAGEGVWDLAWEYWDGLTYGAITGADIDDRTDSFRTFGVNTVSFTMPTDWEKRTVEGIEGFVVRARVDSFTSETTQPLATQIWYETGLWWTWIDSLGEDDNQSFVLYLGGPAMQDHHQIFLSNEGIITNDSPTIEPGLTYAFQFIGRLDLRNIGACLICKGDDFRLTITDTDEITLSITGSGGLTLVVDGITLPATGTHVVGIDSDVDDITLTVTPGGSATGTSQDIPDNSSGYLFSTTGAAVYLDSIAMTTTGLFGEIFSFDTEAEWDTGTFDNVVSTGGPTPLWTQYYITETEVDDGEWLETCDNFSNTATFNNFGYDGNAGCTSVNTFFRLPAVHIPQGATITSANLNIVGRFSNSSTTVNFRISAIDEDDPDAPSTFNDAENATRTTAFTDWNDVEQFFINLRFDTPSITSVIQEIVSRPGWVSGNAIVMYIEDNGSTTVANTKRTAGGVEESFQRAIRLEVTYSIPALSDDFIELDEETFDGFSFSGIVPHWISSDNNVGVHFDGQGTGAHGQRSGLHSGFIRLPGGPIGNFRTLQQDLVASAGQVWSFGFYEMLDFSSSQTSVFIVTWRDSGGSDISSFSINISSDSFDQRITSDGNTAPSGTASVNILFKTTCGSTTLCGQTNNGIHIDDVVACVCNPVPNFPDASNVVLNPGFEEVNYNTGTWTSGTLDSLSTNVLTSAVFWTAREVDGFTSSQEELTVSISTTASQPFVVVENSGDPIPGVNPGDDATQLGIRLRFTLQATGSSPTNAQCFNEASCSITPIVSEALVFLATEGGPTNSDLFYQLNTTPSFSIDDRSVNNNIGDLNLPLRPILPVAFVGALTPVSPQTIDDESSGLGSPSFADEIRPPTNVFPSSSVGGLGQNMPLFPLFQLVIDQTGVPGTIFMTIVAMVVVIYAGVAVYQGFNSITVAYLAMLTAMIAFTLIDSGVLPWWIVLVFGFAGGFWVFQARTQP